MVNTKRMLVLRYLSLGALMLMLLGFGSGGLAAPASQTGTDLFSDAIAAGDGKTVQERAAVRSRFVKVNLDLLGGADPPPDAQSNVADTLVLNLFEDVTLTAVLDEVVLNPSGSRTWTGHLEGVEYSQVNMVVKEGVVVGTIAWPGGFYRVGYAGSGIHAVTEIDQSAFSPELEPIPADVPLEPLAGVPLAPTADDGSIIDVLVVYTGEARAAQGGTTAMQNLIDLAIDETNQSYANSGIAQRVRLVHTEEVTYNEADFNWETTLGRLTGDSDGYMDHVHTLRDTYCADEVVLIVGDATSCGLAWLMVNVSPGFEDNAFALVSYDCTTGYYSFGHEMGHNMGARHDWYVDDTNYGIGYAYAHAYVNTADRWRTIMAYNKECSDQSFNCQRLQYWSNPNVTYGGDPMGVPAGTSTACTAGVQNPNCDADNRLTLNNTALTVANFRDSSVCGPPPTYAINGTIRDSSGSGISGVTVDFGGAQPAVPTNSSGFYTQSDFDNGTYTVTISHSGYTFSPMQDQVTVSGGDATHDVTGYTFNPTSLPFSDGFEGGTLGSAWAVETDFQGRVQVGSADSHAGTYSLLLDDDTNGVLYSHASAILALDLSSQSQADLSFWWRDFDDEDDADDGVFISDDYGQTWYRVVSFNGGSSTFTQATVDLDARAGDAGMSLNDHFLVKFQFYDNWPIYTDGTSSDGYAIDDVEVTGAGLFYHSQAIDDDTGGQSNGDGDNRIDCGEQVELTVGLSNVGATTATDIVATISSGDPHITFTHNLTSAFGDIAGLGTGTNLNDFEIDVGPSAPHGHHANLHLSVEANGGGPWSSDFDVVVYCATDWVYLPVIVRGN